MLAVRHITTPVRRQCAVSSTVQLLILSVESFISADAPAADGGLNMEVQLHSPGQGQLGASVSSLENVRQACMDLFYVVSSVASPHHFLAAAGFASLHIWCSAY